MTLSGNSKFPPDIKAMINGETQLSADVINDFLQDLLDRTEYCKNHLEALQTYLGVTLGQKKYPILMIMS